MSPKISVLIRKNSYKVIKVITSLTVTRSVQSDRRYCQYSTQ
jgi:hypothetical protein